jgi:hypothetical protein
MALNLDKWSNPHECRTLAGPRTVRRFPLETGCDVWTAYDKHREEIKAARFSVGKAYKGPGWELTHWEADPGQFLADLATLHRLIAAATGKAAPTAAPTAATAAEEPAAAIIEAPAYEPLTTPQAARLYDWQRPSAQIIIHALRTGNGIDASQTGAGKTIVALVACAELGLTPYILAPLAVLIGWRRAAHFMGIRIGGLTNYDRARMGTAHFIKKLPRPPADPADRKKKKDEGPLFEFAPPPEGDLFNPTTGKALLILDECQKCRSRDTLQGQILIDCALQGAKILLLSATAAKNPLEMYGIGLALGLHAGKSSFYQWASAHGCERKPFYMKGSRKPQYKLEFTEKPDVAALAIKRIHRAIFPARGTRIRAADVPGYPKNKVTAHLIESDEIKTAYAQFSREFELIRQETAAGKKGETEANNAAMEAVMKIRKASERGKLDFFIDEARELVADGFFVVVFLNFREHCAYMRKELGLKDPPVWGTEWLRRESYLAPDGTMKERDINGPAQTPEKRQRIIDNFQGTPTSAPTSQILIVSLMAGGAGINLHDEHGHGPRQSLISPSYSIDDLIQAAGRIWRASSKSKATQRIIFAAGTVEEEIAANLEAKAANLETMNDGDLRSDSMARVIAMAETAERAAA